MKTKRFLSVMLAAITVMSCIVVPTSAKVTSADFTAVELDCSTYDIRKYTDPFWEGNIVYNEIVHPIREKDGTLPDFPLMYDASEIVYVKDYTLNITYREGIDYELVDGKLRILPTGSIFVQNYTDIHTSTVPAGYGADQWQPYYPRADKSGWEYWTGGSDICVRSLAVTYIHNDTWDAPVPESQESNLPNTFEKLKNKEALTIVVAGDSVAAGALSSATLGISPSADAYPEMTEKALQKKYNNPDIDLINSAIGGTISEFSQSKMENTIIKYSPDLVILNFGMNDSSYNRVGLPKSQFKNNNAQQIEYIKSKLPECEVLLVSSLYGNRYTFPAEKYEEHAQALHELAAEYDGVGVADPQAIEKYLIEETGKDYICFTADNMVHPGDLGMRLTAQSILEALSFEDLDTYRAALIENMSEYANIDSVGNNKREELEAYISGVEEAIADLRDEWDVTAYVDAAYEDLDKIILRCDVHDFIDTIVPPTCKDKGYTHSVCVNCKNDSIHSYTEPLGGEHIMDSGRTTVFATHKTEGEITYTCVKCGYEEKEVVPVKSNPSTISGQGMVHFANNHNYMAASVKPYSSGTGVVEFDFCPWNIEKYSGIPYVGVWFSNYSITACYNFRDQEVQIIKTDLPFSGGTVYASAKYDWTTDNGEYQYNWKKFAVRFSGNNVKIYIDGELILNSTNSAYSATSEVALIYSNGECYMDNVKLYKGNYNPETGTGGTSLGSWDFNSTSSYNSFFSGWTQSYATRTHVNATDTNITTGKYVHTCSGPIVDVINPGCGFEGYTQYACSMCGKAYFGKMTSAVCESHTLINQRVTVEPTPITEGQYVYDCETCDMTFTEIIPKGTNIGGDDDDDTTETVIKGDVDGNGSVNSTDFVLFARFLSGAYIELPLEAGDMNDDRRINNLDFSIITSLIKGAK